VTVPLPAEPPSWLGGEVTLLSDVVQRMSVRCAVLGDTRATATGAEAFAAIERLSSNTYVTDALRLGGGAGVGAGVGDGVVAAAAATTVTVAVPVTVSSTTLVATT
jgi:hypothetical protein